MKKQLLYLAFLSLIIFLGGCSYKIKRTAYKAPEEKQELNSQNVILKKQMGLKLPGLVKVGSVELKDNGFTSNCHENDALAQLKLEAQYAGGQLVNIIEDKRTDKKSTCYRCKAEIYQINNDSLLQNLQNDKIYEPKLLEERVLKDRKKNRQAIVGGVVGGIIGGLLAGLLVAAMQ
jgi:outer membrane lipopolysaccharide assembly protein LptE/RlpB